MSLTLTPDMLAAAYELLRTTPPFRGWKLPPSSAIKFKVSRATREFGHFAYTRDDGAPKHISCSDRKHGQLNTLLATMAHEMIHLHQRVSGHKGPAHGAVFQRFADRICRLHGFDRKTF